VKPALLSLVREAIDIPAATFQSALAAAAATDTAQMVASAAVDATFDTLEVAGRRYVAGLQDEKGRVQSSLVTAALGGKSWTQVVGSARGDCVTILQRYTVHAASIPALCPVPADLQTLADAVSACEKAVVAWQSAERAATRAHQDLEASRQDLASATSEVIATLRASYKDGLPAVLPRFKRAAKKEAAPVKTAA